MRCREALRLLVMEDVSDYGSPPWRVRLERHLRGCGFCREEVARLGSETAVIRAAFKTLPLRPSFAAEVWGMIDGET